MADLAASPGGLNNCAARPAWAGRSMSGATFAALMSTIFALGAALRFWDLARAPIWMDEAFSYMAAQLPLQTILFGQIDNHPPLFFALQHLWLSAQPSIEALRVPAALAGSLAVLITGLATADLVSRRAGLAAAAYLALCTGHIYFSQDARMYPLLSLGLALAFWGLVGLAQRPERRLPYAALYVAGGVVAVYSQLLALVFLALLNAALVLWAVAAQRWKAAVAPIVLSNLVLGVLSIPWLLSMATAMDTFHGLKTFGPRTAVWFFNNMVGFPGLPKPLKTPANLLFVALLLFGAFRAWRGGERAVVLATVTGLLAFPMALVVLNTREAILENRVFTPCEVAAAVLFGLAATSLKPAALRYAVLSAVLLLSAASSFAEHRLRVKPEDPRQVLVSAAQHGFSEAPVVTCHFLPAMSAHLTAPDHPVYFLGLDGPVRVDQDFHRVIAMSMNALHRARSADYARYIGGNANVAQNERTLASGGRVIAVSSSCRENRVDEYLSALGMTKVAEPAIHPAPRTIFTNVYTEVGLWKKPGA
ncbi:glycosyltransferase family 39 protein [Phenylobacterium deserti]|uniref:Uncharacterized protein n=1 Tax=Phenylobacterium deserti TaxID=1914756 RepID=A0A328ADJ6_9CAUL|nr:glycosyltransferase family 39 protein [Phenylobacterium deserti]RAK52842.1 hypothetical protein DJ018_11725 [Phenylobacterium deserti]